MNEVKKLWYTETGEIRLMKEWIEEPSKPGSWAHQEFFEDYYDDMAKYHKSMDRIKSESLPVVNYEDVVTFMHSADKSFKGNTGDFVTANMDTFHDLTGATWEEVSICHRGSCVHSDAGYYADGMPGESCSAEKYAEIHLPKRGAGDNYPVVEQTKHELDQKTIINIAAAARKHRNELPVTYRPSVRDVCEASFSMGAKWAYGQHGAELAAAHKRIEELEKEVEHLKHIRQRAHDVIHDAWWSAQEKIEELKKRLPK